MTAGQGKEYNPEPDVPSMPLATLVTTFMAKFEPDMRSIVMFDQVPVVSREYCIEQVAPELNEAPGPAFNAHYQYYSGSFLHNR